MLRKTGVSKYQQKQQLADHKLQLIRQGWYAEEGADSDAVRAIRHRGQVGCISGCDKYGLWIPPQYREELHICLTNRDGIDSRLAKRGIIAHRGGDPELRVLRPLEDCLNDVIKHHDAETALILLESALNFKLISFEEGQALISKQPAYKQRQLRFFTPGAQSGSETRVRLFFDKRGVKARAQEKIKTVGRVDILVGRSLIVECDSWTHHSSNLDRHNDWTRDLNARNLGYDVIRLSYEQVWHQWDDTKKRLSNQLRKRKHRLLP